MSELNSRDFVDSIDSITAELPAPLAQALLSVKGATSSADRLKAANRFLSVILAAAAAVHVAALLARGKPRPETCKRLGFLECPNLADWLALVDEKPPSSGEAAAAGEPAAPGADLYERLHRREAAWPYGARLKRGETGGQGKTPDPEAMSAIDVLRKLIYLAEDSGSDRRNADGGRDEEAGLILLQASLEAYRRIRPFGDLAFALAVDDVDATGGRTVRRYDALGVGGTGARLDLPSDVQDCDIPAGRLVLAAGERRVVLHPVFVVDWAPSGKLRLACLRRAEHSGVYCTNKETLRFLPRVEYADCATGQALAKLDAVQAVRAFLAGVRGGAIA